MMRIFGERREADLASLDPRNRRHQAHGGPVSPEHALRLGAVWSCVDLICRLAGLPIDQYRRIDGAPVEIPRSPLFDSPSHGMHLLGWTRQILMSWLLHGNVFGAVAARDRHFWPTQIEILDPSRMRATRRGADGPIRWLVDGKDLGDDLIHWPAFTVPGSIIGLSPIEYHAMSIGLGIHASGYGARWFEEGAHPSSILKTDKTVSKGDATTIKERFMASIRGGEPAVLGSGFTWEQVQVNPEESQFLDTIKANKADIAGMFLVPPEMIGGEAGNSLTYATLEGRALHYLTFTADWWLTLLEHLFTSLVPTGNYVKLNRGAFVRVDVKTQAEVEAIRIRGGWGTPDEARENEDRPPLPDGLGQRLVWPPYSTTPPKPSAGGAPDA